MNETPSVNLSIDGVIRQLNVVMNLVAENQDLRQQVRQLEQVVAQYEELASELEKQFGEEQSAPFPDEGKEGRETSNAVPQGKEGEGS